MIKHMMERLHFLNSPLGKIFWIVLFQKKGLISKSSVIDNEIMTCKYTQFGMEYQGHANVTKSRRDCQRWGNQEPHAHFYTDLADQENFCRNPDMEPEGPWCYTTDPFIRWEYCYVPFCETTNSIQTDTTFSHYSASSKMTTETFSAISTKITTGIYTPETTRPSYPNTCFCPCSHVNYRIISHEELVEMIENIKSTLTIDRKTTSSYKRHHISASDDRKSSQTIGTVGIVFLSIIALFVLLNDLLSLIRYCCDRRNR